MGLGSPYSGYQYPVALILKLGLSLEEKARLIEENPDYGEVICRCEKVTKAEILQAIHNCLGVSTMAGIKYRTRSMMGRCQGGFCLPLVTQIISEYAGVPAEEVKKSGPAAVISYGRKGAAYDGL